MGSLVLDSTEKVWFIYSIVEMISQFSLSDWSDAKSILESFA